eukprot:symbB.v1.2.004750.t1/scaffold275.1/size244369/20
MPAKVHCFGGCAGAIGTAERIFASAKAGAATATDGRSTCVPGAYGTSKCIGWRSRSLEHGPWCQEKVFAQNPAVLQRIEGCWQRHR